MAGHGREAAFTAALAVAMIQLGLATDNERVAAASCPFELAWSAPKCDARAETDRRLAVRVFVARSRWLLEVGPAIV